MVIKTLVENTTINDNCGCEHGLSLYVETKKHRILFDLGQGELFLKNASELGIDISQIDIVVISHGHSDHGGGLSAFLKVNEKAKIFIHQKAFENHYSLRDEGKTVYIGLDQELKINDRIVFVGDNLNIDDELELFSNVTGNELPSVCNNTLLMKKSDEKMQDTFEHEQNLIITEDEKSVLIAGCAHKGIVNIVNKAKNVNVKEIDFVFAGFHLHNPNTKVDEETELIEEIGKRLKETNTGFYTGHCTGIGPYNKLKNILGDNIHYLATGSVVEI